LFINQSLKPIFYIHETDELLKGVNCNEQLLSKKEKKKEKHTHTPKNPKQTKQNTQKQTMKNTFQKQVKNKDKKL
jgi:hypothetical protein